MNDYEKDIVETLNNGMKCFDRIINTPEEKMMRIGRKLTSTLWSIPVGVIRRLCELQDRVRPYYEKKTPVSRWQRCLLLGLLGAFIILAVLYNYLSSQESVRSILISLLKIDLLIIGTFFSLSICADLFLAAARSVRKLLSFLLLWAIYPALAGLVVGILMFGKLEFSGSLIYGLWGMTWVVASALADPRAAKLANKIIGGIPAAISLCIFIFSEKIQEQPIKILLYFTFLAVLSELVIASMEYYRNTRIKAENRKRIRSI